MWFFFQKLGLRVIKLWFLNFPPFFTIFRNISTFQDARFSKKIIFTIVSIASSSFKILYLFCPNLKFKFCCQPCDAIFPPKAVKIEKQKTQDFLEYRVLPFCKDWPQTNKKCKSSSYIAAVYVLWAPACECNASP